MSQQTTYISETLARGSALARNALAFERTRGLLYMLSRVVDMVELAWLVF